MSDPIYKVIEWDRHFENNRSRTVENLRWVCVPNRHDGEGYSLLMEQDNAAELFAAWVLILQVASKCHLRGTLVRDDGSPLTAKSLAIKTRGEQLWFEKALNFFTTKVKWLERQETATQVTDDCQAPVTQVTKKEEKEENGIEVKNPAAVAPEQKPKRVSRKGQPKPESQDEFYDFIREIGLYLNDASWLWNKWEGNGWLNGKAPIKDWKATVRSWKEGEYFPSQKPGGQAKSWPADRAQAAEPEEEVDMMAMLRATIAKEEAELYKDHPDNWTAEEWAERQAIDNF